MQTTDSALIKDIKAFLTHYTNIDHDAQLAYKKAATPFSGLSWEECRQREKTMITLNKTLTEQFNLLIKQYEDPKNSAIASTIENILRAAKNMLQQNDRNIASITVSPFSRSKVQTQIVIDTMNYLAITNHAIQSPNTENLKALSKAANHASTMSKDYEGMANRLGVIGMALFILVPVLGGIIFACAANQTVTDHHNAAQCIEPSAKQMGTSLLQLANHKHLNTEKADASSKPSSFFKIHSHINRLFKNSDHRPNRASNPTKDNFASPALHQRKGAHSV